MFFKLRHTTVLTFILFYVSANNLCIIQAYSQVASSGSNDSPKIFKALNMDLIYPKTFNSSENVISTTQMPVIFHASVQATTPATITNVEISLPQFQQQQQQAEQAAIFVTPPARATAAAAATNHMKLHEMPAEMSETPIIVPQDNQAYYEQPRDESENVDESENEEEEEEQQQQQIEQYASTGRAVDYRPTYQLNQLLTPLIKNTPQPSSSSQAYNAYGYNTGQAYRARPIKQYQQQQQQRQQQQQQQTQSMSSIGKIIYPQAYQQRQRQPNRAEIDKLQGKVPISDRFSPSEGVASSLFGKNKNHNHNHHHPNGNGNKRPAASNVVQSYVAPKDIYSFPPNINSKYPPPAQDPKAALPTSSVNSYVAPPSGHVINTAGYPLAAASSNSNGYKYTGPLSPAYLPPAGGADDQKGAEDDKDAGGDNNADNGDDNIGVLPASAMDADDSKDADGMKDMPSSASMDAAGGDEHDHDHEHPHDYDSEKEYPTPPPGWVEEHPETVHDHDHSHDHLHDHSPEHEHSLDHDHYFEHGYDDYHDHFPSYPIYPYHPHPHYPEIIYDDHHHDHVVETTLPPPSTDAPPPPPPPEPAPEPRVKKYSYFYIGRKLWYIPLYFTVWFSFYVLWLILKSIARHKVNLPNHYVSRRSLDYNTDAKAHEYINQLTVKVLEHIDDFKRKYVT